MKIAELHKTLHPKLKTYTGDGKRYTHRLSSDMDVTIRKVGFLRWKVEVHERSEVSSAEYFLSESRACEEALKIAKRA